MSDSNGSNLTASRRPHPGWRGAWIAIFGLAAVLWSVHINRPVDLPTWHEFDYASIARNFVREGNNIAYPRIDWRGNGPGFTEMEFPIVPWTIAQMYRVFGIHEIIGRILSLAFALLSLAVFRRIALKVLPERAAIIAALFFVVAHVVTQIATALQPEAPMLFFYLLAVYYFLDWYERKTWVSYALAAACFSSAMLVKSPAAHLAIFFLLWALHKDGLRAFRRISLYLFAVLAFAPVLLWYGHAASFWHQFNNSMGVSNEDHWFGLDLLRRPKIIANLIGLDVLLVCGGGGIIAALAGFANTKRQSSLNKLAGYWLAAICVYLLVILRTSSAYWAAYYHVIAVPPLALLFGAGVYQIQIRGNKEWRASLAFCGVATGLLIALFTCLGQRDSALWPGILQDLLAARSSSPVLLVLALFSLTATVLCLYVGQDAAGHFAVTGMSRTTTRLAPIVAMGCCTYFFFSGQLLLGTWKNFANRTPQFTSAQLIKDKIAPRALIVASGGICFDQSGHRVANNAPNVFYWLDHKGFSTCQGQESILQLKSMASHGAEYFVADKLSLSRQPSFQLELQRSFLQMADTGPLLLFNLQESVHSMSPVSTLRGHQLFAAK